jgi:adenylosuccinate synthase
MNTNFVFTPGTLTTILDAQAGSSGKGKVGSFIAQHADNWQFACHAFFPQAGHWVKLDDGRSFFYQTFNSCAYQIDRYEKLYIGPGAILELPALFRELEENRIPRHKIGISPLAAILQDIDVGYERGTCDFDGQPVSELHDGTMKRGSTAHGAGACRARRVLRRPEKLYARDVPELKEFICDVPGEILSRLERHQAGLLEIAQGFQLSYLLPHMFPYTTSRNCTVAAALDDMMLPTWCVGDVILNVRTFPIRINNNKYLGQDGRHLSWEEVQQFDREGKPYNVYEGNSGPGYPDQKEITWDEVTTLSGSPDKIMEITSVTKLPRRVFTFSKQNLREAIRHNNTGRQTYISLNFINYADHAMTGRRGTVESCYSDPDGLITQKARQWIEENIQVWPHAKLKFLGTGPLTDDMIVSEP